MSSNPHLNLKGQSDGDQRAETEFHEYTRLLAIANEELTFETACAAAKQWGRFLAAYNSAAPNQEAAIH